MGKKNCRFSCSLNKEHDDNICIFIEGMNIHLIFMKITFLLILSLFLINTGQNSQDSNAYYPILSGSSSQHRYVEADAYVTYTVLEEKRIFKNQEYNIVAVEYSWESLDSFYLREEDGILYYLDEISRTESVLLPKRIEQGRKWMSVDGAWEYEILSLNAHLETSVKKYEELLLIQSRQLMNRDKSRSKKYFNYYQRGKGQIATADEEGIMTYLMEE